MTVKASARGAVAPAVSASVSSPSSPFHKFGVGILIGLVCALAVLGAQQRGWLASVERTTLDGLFRARGPQYPSEKVVVIVADDATVAQSGSWPLPRRIYADVVRKLHQSGTKTIAFDIVFSKPSSSPADDAALVSACRTANSVISAAVFPLPAADGRRSTLELAGDIPLPAPRFGMRREQGLGALRPWQAVNSIGPRPELQRGSAAVGHINATPDPDGILRRMAHLIEFRGVVYPSLALASTTHFLGIPLSDIQSDGNRTITLPAQQKRYAIPLDSSGGVLVNWIGGMRSFPTFSFQQLLAGDVPPEILKGRIALVGVTATAAFDHRSSPFTPVQPAVEVQANAINDILAQRILQPVPPWAHAALLIIVVMLAGAWMSIGNAWKSVVLASAASAALWGIGLLLLTRNLYLPVGAPILALLLTLAASISYRQWRDVHQLRLAEERYALAAEGSNDGLWDWDLQADRFYVSPRWQEVIGARGAIIGEPAHWLSRVHPDDRKQLDADLENHLGNLSRHLENEHRLLHEDGTYRWVLCRGLAVRGKGGKAIRMAGSISDITERKQAEEQIRFDALHDGLTELPNRTLLTNFLERAVEQKKQHPDYNFALLLLDIDHFKVVNDSLGHQAGDELLIEIARRLKTALHSNGMPARIGGDEFAVLYDTSAQTGGGELAEVGRIAQQVLQALARPLHIKEHEVFVAASIGIVHNVAEYSNPEEIIRDAEIAMYRAKAAGRSRYEIFDAKMHRQIVSRLKLESDLRRAIERRELRLHYQPIVALANRRIAGFEALIRWQHPDGHLVSPGDFIPLAEETGLIIEMDLWGLREACRQLKQWNKARHPAGMEQPLFVSVNLSRKLFTVPDLVTRIGSILDESEFDPAHLKLEITESAIVENTESAAATLHELKALGAQISIDDFGTGYSSLSYLHHFPLDVLKIDRSFINGIEADEGKHKIVWTIIAMARNLGMAIVAEGVETPEQMQILQTLTCDFSQGFFFSRPLAAADAQNLLATHPDWSTPADGLTESPIPEGAKALV